MVLGSGVVVWHSISDDRSWRTWYAGTLVAATATLTICLNIEDSTGHVLVSGWALPGIAPALYLLGTELGLNELRLLMRRLRARIRLATPTYNAPALPTPTKKDAVRAVLRETGWHVPTALRLSGGAQRRGRPVVRLRDKAGGGRRDQCAYGCGGQYRRHPYRGVTSQPALQPPAARKFRSAGLRSEGSRVRLREPSGGGTAPLLEPPGPARTAA